MSEQIFCQDKDGIYRGENAEKVLSYLLEEVDYRVGKREKVSRYRICDDYYGALGYYFNEKSKLWCAFDNTSGECFIKVFKSAEEAEKWVNRVEEDGPCMDDIVDKSNDCERCDDWRDFFADRDSDTYCPDCGNLIIHASAESLINEAEYWWRNGASLEDYEVVSGLYEYDFSPANDCKEFIDACYDVWNSKTNAEKIMIWKTINYREEY